jgi:hypothetical protein
MHFIMCFQFSIQHAEYYPSTIMWWVSHLFIHLYEITSGKLSNISKTKNWHEKNELLLQKLLQCFLIQFICEIAEENFTTGMSMKLQRNLHHNHFKVTPQLVQSFNLMGLLSWSQCVSLNPKPGHKWGHLFPQHHAVVVSFVSGHAHLLSFICVHNLRCYPWMSLIRKG